MSATRLQTAPDMSGQVRFDSDGARLSVQGRLTIDSFEHLDRDVIAQQASRAEVVDIAQLSHMDTAGAWFLLDLAGRTSAGAASVITGASDAQTLLIEAVRTNLPPKAAGAKPAVRLVDHFETLGRRVALAGSHALEMLSFLGQVIAAMARVIRHPRALRLTSVVHHCQQVGLQAVPIVALMAFLIGVVLAFQGSAQLRQFGAEVFVVDLIAISILRELGILLTAIIVAGRSGSAFTAAIGSMKMREEIDAMRTLGLDPVAILVVPRVLALVLMLPALGLIANVSGLFGGALMSWIELDVSPAVFQARLVSNTDVWHFNVGMIKAPVFALIIGIIGCYQGMKVGGDAESLGRQTSASVVMAIFMVIVADALFSIFFAIVGV
ncbi:ABC transporter permease [Yoonia vestfoldensis]|uniref:ABC transporter, inner membrane subunit n=1 Tax=Yoonia vestfoldensis SKA53 TaxID=314232 RepID=A3V7Z5_9RHOB|nr:ABC transporter permease [Yoonia vestfoldensis]EAQ05795.1 ABC transporter, inner membrane subunit [Yoonia vestfoldensis SKA53]